MTERRYTVDIPAQRRGKSLFQATITAAMLKAGKTVYLAQAGGVEKIVGVPGFDDGRQLTAPKGDQ